MRIPLVLTFVIIGSLLACVHQPGPLLPVSTVTGAAVAIEDLTEDPLCDPVETSFLEGLDDFLNSPWNILWQIVAFQGSVWWGLGDAVAGNSPEFPVKYARIMEWMPVHYSGVPPRLDDPPPAKKYGRSWQLPSAEPAAVACPRPSPAPLPAPPLDPGCEPGGGRMSRPQADQLVADVEQMGWRVTDLHEAGNSGKWAFDMVNDRSQITVCIEGRLDYERKMAGLKLKDELQQADPTKSAR